MAMTTRQHLGRLAAELNAKQADLHRMKFAWKPYEAAREHQFVLDAHLAQVKLASALCLPEPTQDLIDAVKAAEQAVATHRQLVSSMIESLGGLSVIPEAEKAIVQLSEHAHRLDREIFIYEDHLRHGLSSLTCRDVQLWCEDIGLPVPVIPALSPDGTQSVDTPADGAVLMHLTTEDLKGSINYNSMLLFRAYVAQHRQAFEAFGAGSPYRWVANDVINFLASLPPHIGASELARQVGSGDPAAPASGVTLVSCSVAMFMKMGVGAPPALFAAIRERIRMSVRDGSSPPWAMGWSAAFPLSRLSPPDVADRAHAQAANQQASPHQQAGDQQQTVNQQPAANQQQANGTAPQQPTEPLPSRDELEASVSRAVEQSKQSRASTMMPAPEDTLCPLTGELFEDPVRAADGVTYERAALLLRWSGGEWASPKTGETLRGKKVEIDGAAVERVAQYLADAMSFPIM